MSPIELLQYGKENKVPAADLLVRLEFLNDSYQRFLIDIIFYQGYATPELVLKDLIGSQEIMSIWGFLEYESAEEWEKELGIDNLNRSGLQFIDQFLWWKQDLTSFSHEKSAQGDDK